METCRVRICQFNCYGYFQTIRSAAVLECYLADKFSTRLNEINKSKRNRHCTGKSYRARNGDLKRSREKEKNKTKETKKNFH